MLDNIIIKLSADLLKCIGNPIRIKIIYLLENNELCVCNIMNI
ncbi:ArsR family transcriptional regulator [Pectinatus brassicae]|uniref:DNA-binding transcriptional ArsR family regulator n=1 Tax=Pectinatus brassicae TaxID=862415 RepID=A0A840UHM2_9FIRM|nr:DNA-binding transcriptional ArsR family regulator [Pectinatus brassicae]